MKKLFFLGLLAILLILGGCSESDSDSDSGSGSEGGRDKEAPPLKNKDLVFKMEFEESGGWNETGHEGWARWCFYNKDEDDFFDSFDLSSMLTNNKVYILTYSFSTNINIDELTTCFYNIGGAPDWHWQNISQWKTVKRNIEKGKLCTGKIVYTPESNAAGLLPEYTHIRFDAHNRNVDTKAIIYFYQFDLEQVDKEALGLETWDVSGKTFDIDSLYTFAKKETTFQSKSNVLHIKPTYGSNEYSDFVMRYDLNGYKGKKIKIEMSMDVYLTTPSWIAWQINSKPTPFYPVVLGAVKGSGGIDTNGNPSSSTPLTANTWHTITGTYTFTVPNTEPTDDNGKQLYLSGQQIAGAEAYFANAAITITVQP